MKKKDIITVKIDGVRFPNKAFGYVEGEKVVVKNAIPGQTVQAQVTKKRSGAVEARLLGVMEPSDLERTEGYCSHYAICGGCTYQTMQRQAELDMKERQVRQLLEEAGWTMGPGNVRQKDGQKLELGLLYNSDRLRWRNKKTGDFAVMKHLEVP